MARARDTLRKSRGAASNGRAPRSAEAAAHKQVRSRPKALAVKVVRLPHAEGLPLPAYQSEDAAGLDLLAAVPANKALTLRRGARALVPTGLILELPPGFEGQVRPRSGLAYRHGVTVLNSPGTIDSDYRGEVQVLLINLGDQAFTIKRGERIAQLVIAPVTRAALVEGRAASATARGAGGFGSTGRGGIGTAALASKRKQRARSRVR